MEPSKESMHALLELQRGCAQSDLASYPSLRIFSCPFPVDKDSMAFSTAHHQWKYNISPVNSIFLSSKQGTVGFENQINKCLELAEYLYAKIKNREEFEMVFNGEVSCHHGLDI